MFRFLFRLGVIALVVLSLSAPAQALPLAGESPGSRLSLSEIWERFTSAVTSLWMGRGTCDPNGGVSAFGPVSCDPAGGSTNS